MFHSFLLNKVSCFFLIILLYYLLFHLTGNDSGIKSQNMSLPTESLDLELLVSRDHVMRVGEWRCGVFSVCSVRVLCICLCVR